MTQTPDRSRRIAILVGLLEALPPSVAAETLARFVPPETPTDGRLLSERLADQPEGALSSLELELSRGRGPIAHEAEATLTARGSVYATPEQAAPDTNGGIPVSVEIGIPKMTVGDAATDDDDDDGNDDGITMTGASRFPVPNDTVEARAAEATARASPEPPLEEFPPGRGTQETPSIVGRGRGTLPRLGDGLPPIAASESVRAVIAEILVGLRAGPNEDPSGLLSETSLAIGAGTIHGIVPVSKHTLRVLKALADSHPDRAVKDAADVAVFALGKVIDALEDAEKAGDVALARKWSLPTASSVAALASTLLDFPIDLLLPPEYAAAVKATEAIGLFVVLLAKGQQ